MRNLLGTLALLALVLALVGWSRDWFTVSSKESGKETEVHLRIDRTRIRQDTQEAAAAARQISERLEQRIAERAQAAEEENPR